MSRFRPSSVLTLAFALAALAAAFTVGFASSRPAAAEEPAKAHHVVYLNVSGEGPQTKAWYDGGPPSGTSVQAALNTFASQGYRFAAISSSGSASLTHVTG